MIRFVLAAAALAPSPPTSAPACPIDHAVYRLHGAPEFSAGFLRQDRRKVFASDLVFWLKTSKRVYYFSFASPNGYGGTYIVPDLDPRLSARLGDDEEVDESQRVRSGDPPSVPFDAFGSDLSVLSSPPSSSSPTPAMLFARALGPALWYDWTALAGRDEKAARESMPIGLFELSGCEGPPPAG